MSVNRTPQQEAEENTVLEQAAQIQAARKAEQAQLQAQLQAQRKAAAPPPPGKSFGSLLDQVFVKALHSCRFFVHELPCQKVFAIWSWQPGLSAPS